MNSLHGNIIDIAVSGNFSIVSVATEDKALLKAIVIETPSTASYLQKGKEVKMLFKETEVIIGLGAQDTISVQNKISGTIQKIEHGELLSKILIDTPAGIITSIISTNATKNLALKPETKVMAMIKLNEVMLSEI